MRSLLALGLVWFWSLRLTWSYFRREKWRVGWREDWRFANYRESMGWFWLPASFFVAFVSQHLMLLGLTLPFYAAHQSTEALGVWDAITCVLCVSGVVIAWNADDQLFAFMTGNAYRRQQGRPTELILEQGLWRYCRHPNHLGEQTWWVGVACFAIAAGQYKAALGLTVNHACDNFVTLGLIEERMLANPKRADAYREYQQRVPMIWPRFNPTASEKKNK